MAERVPIKGRPLRMASERLVLRDLRLSDWAAVFAWRGDSAVAGPMGLEPDGEVESRAWLERAVHHNGLLPRHAYNLAIVLRESGDVAGWIGMNRLAAGGGAKYVEFELSFAVIRSYWGTGYMTEALCTLVPFAFDGLNADRLVAECLPHNWASAHVLEKIGMRGEGWAGDCLRYTLDVRRWRKRGSGT